MIPSISNQTDDHRMMPISLRSRWVFLPLLLALSAVSLYFLRLSIAHSARPHPEAPPPPPPKKDGPIHKSINRTPIPPPPEYFPLAATALSSSDLPPIPSWNTPPDPHVPESTRLYIGFTRYWPLLQQVVVSYITAGWPPSDIYVVENTGTMDANKRGLLSSTNPFYLDYHRLTAILGVNIISTPSLQTFAQLQNLYFSQAINDNLTHYFWSHMDVAVHPHENFEEKEFKQYKSLYMRAVDVVRETQAPDYLLDKETGKKGEWGVQFFAYDWLTMVNVATFAKLGGWDTMVGYYGTDCDMYARLSMNGYHQPIQDAGMIYDVTNSLEDLEVLYRRRPKKKRKDRSLAEEETEKERRDDDTTTNKTFIITPNPPNTDPDRSSSPNLAYLSSTEPDTLASPLFTQLASTLNSIQDAKRADPYRNSWQLRQNGGEGEPYYYDPEGWEKALQMTIETGAKINEEKWGHKGCDIKGAGLREGDQWRVEHDSSFD
ncbi:MAG: hypothetical protein Q9220_005941 [cf. Caloplaca sp. 1 TL-2023]